MSTGCNKKLRRAVVTGLALMAVGLSPATWGAHDDLGTDGNMLLELGDQATPLTPGSGDIVGDGSAATGPDWADIFVFGTPPDLDHLTKNFFGGAAASFILDDVSAGNLVDRTAFPKGSDKNSDKVSEWLCLNMLLQALS